MSNTNNGKHKIFILRNCVFEDSHQEKGSILEVTKTDANKLFAARAARYATKEDEKAAAPKKGAAKKD